MELNSLQARIHQASPSHLFWPLHSQGSYSANLKKIQMFLNSLTNMFSFRLQLKQDGSQSFTLWCITDNMKCPKLNNKNTCLRTQLRLILYVTSIIMQCNYIWQKCTLYVDRHVSQYYMICIYLLSIKIENMPKNMAWKRMFSIHSNLTRSRMSRKARSCWALTHWAHDVVPTLNQRLWRWINIATTSCGKVL